MTGRTRTLSILTDEGLLAEFEDHKTKGAEELALHNGSIK
jgi:hypothetical protein